LYVLGFVAVAFVMSAVFSINYGMSKSKETWDRCEKAGGVMVRYECIKKDSVIKL
jgi:hypothetical protein